MDPGAVLKTFIYLISSSLLYPVLLLLAGLTLVIVVMVGSFFAEWLERVRLEPCSPAVLPARLVAGEA
ncbi:MAG TPA: biopolymer transporter, partial [Proteobacteria bacterium]|nr:biopolymer transporter [Pseudomonadota bacterium]